MKYRAGKSSGIIKIANEPKEMKMYVFLHSHHSLHYDKKDKEVLFKTL